MRSLFARLDGESMANQSTTQFRGAQPRDRRLYRLFGVGARPARGGDSLLGVSAHARQVVMGPGGCRALVWRIDRPEAIFRPDIERWGLVLGRARGTRGKK